MKTWQIAGLVILAAVAAVITVISRGRSRPPVNITLQIAVSPADKSAFVTREANSARFKYLVGKQSGVKPVFAQRLSVHPLPDPHLLEARVGVMTPDEARLYVGAFVPTLQLLCNTQAQVALAQRNVR